MIEVDLVNVVQLTYSKNVDKGDKTPRWPETAIVHVPENELPPLTEEEKKLGGRPLDVYYKCAVEILSKNIGPVKVYPNAWLYLGKVKILY